MSRRRRLLRRVLVSLVVLVLVLAIAGAGFVTWSVRRSFPQTDGSLTLPGLSAPVTVRRDRYGVPQLSARDADDLFRAQGFVHAQDRFWEMDFRRHVTAGRLSELFGPDQVETDEFVRTLGWRRVAEQELSLLDPQTIRHLQAYADGVNAFLRGRRGSQLSLEHGLLRLTNRSYSPEPWTPADSVSWLKAMAWDLRSNLDEELSRALLARQLPRERVEQLYPEYPYGRHPTILSAADVAASARSAVSAGSASSAAGPSGRVVPRVGAAVDVSVRETSRTAALRRARDAVASVPDLLGPHGSGIGSNSWVVSGAHTATGKPLLANDPHLGPALPSVWAQMGLHCAPVTSACPYDVAGFTFSGVPGVVIGHDADIAWGFTNLAPDVADLYLEKVSGTTYEYAGARLPLTARRETIKVAGGSARTITVRTTRHGPLISDVSTRFARPGRSGGYAVAMRWTALTPGHTMDALFALDRATDWASMQAAARQFEVPAQNIVFADRAGHIGYQAPGRVPVRTGYDGRWPAQGWTGKQEWSGFVPFDSMPSSLDPAEGFVVTANNAVVPSTYPAFLTDDWDFGDRAARIRARLASLIARRPVTAGDLRAVQLDDRSSIAPALLPFLLRAPVTGSEVDAVKVLRAWDLRQDPDSAGAAYFNAVWRHLLALTFDDELSPSLRADGGSRWMTVVRSLLRDPTARWWDDVRTRRVETRDDVVVHAMHDAYGELRGRLGSDPYTWRWGDLHALPLESQTFGQSGIAPIEWLVNHHGPVDVGGGEASVDATGWTARDGYATDWVPSMRMVVDLADLDRSTWVNLTGASGHAFDEHYTDQTALWREGRSTAWPFSPTAVRRAARHTLTLRPTTS